VATRSRAGAYREAFEQLARTAATLYGSTVAHMAGTIDEDLATKLIWNVLAHVKADAETDARSVAWFYPSLHNNLATRTRSSAIRTRPSRSCGRRGRTWMRSSRARTAIA